MRGTLKIMSRVGKKKILIPSGIQIRLDGLKVVVKGPKGEAVWEMEPLAKLELGGGTISVTVKENTKAALSYWGLARAQIANMIKGVIEGYSKELELVGVGYRARLEGGSLIMTLGFSHPVLFAVPEGITFQVPDNQKIIVTGIDKQLVGLTAARIKKQREPEPYKGKGIRYVGEVIRKKQGKTGKA